MSREELFYIEPPTLEQLMTADVNQVFRGDDWYEEPSGIFEARQKKFIGVKKEDGSSVIVYQQRDTSSLSIIRSEVLMTGSDPMLAWKPADRRYDSSPQIESKVERIRNVLQSIAEGTDYVEA